MDSKVVVDKIYRYGQDFSKLGAIIRECKYILSINANYSIKFVKRQTNVVPHSLARVTTDYASFTTCESS
ncbi:hypothetical protein HKD37_14G039405 [Glycine soja]|nr:hypothetical protein GmHk_14G040332 [Glycine max]